MNSHDIRENFGLTKRVIAAAFLSQYLFCGASASFISTAERTNPSPSQQNDPKIGAPNEKILATALAGSSYQIEYRVVENGLDLLYPPADISSRNALSRTDGYWKFIAKGEEPPLHFTYGEFDVSFFTKLLNRAEELFDGDRNGWEGKVFADFGSGAGRLVMAAAALNPEWKLCKGIEVLPGIHQLAEENAEKCRVGINQFKLQVPAGLLEDGISMAPLEFICGSFEDPQLQIGDVDCVFCFSSCMPDGVVEMVSRAVGCGCREGTLVITTDYQLPLHGYVPPKNEMQFPSGTYEFELLDSVDGECKVVGGTSTAYIHRLVKSVRTDKWKSVLQKRI